MALGGGVVGLKYKDGVLLGSDTLLTMYGSTKKYGNSQRHFRFGGEPARTALVTSGYYADTQFMINDLYDLETEDRLAMDGVRMTDAKSIHSYMKLVMYNKRTDFDPALITAIVGGKEPGREPFLGWIDSVGSHAEADSFAGGIATYFCTGLLREATENGKWKELTKEQAKKILVDCMTILFWQDAQAFNRIQITDCTDAGCVSEEPFFLEPTMESKGVAFK